MNEVWKKVKGFENDYEVSNLGNVRSLDRVIHVDRKGARKQNYFSKGKILKTQESNGYLRVRLNNGKTSKRYFVHRLVAEAFLDNPNNYPIVNHKDQTRKNNNVENLEWCSYKYNINYRDCVERIKKKMRTSKPVGKYKDEILIEKYPSISEACMKNKAHHSNMSSAIKRGVKYKGYFWRILND